VQADLWGRAGRIFFEGIVEDVFDAFDRVLVGVTGQRTFAIETVTADIVEAVQVVGMAMGEEHTVDSVDFIAQGLGPEVWARVDEQGVVLVFEVEGTAQPFIFGIVGSADWAMAADARDTD
jgi:hypothetical protein